MTTIARFKKVADATFFQSVLQSEGIESQVLDSGVAPTPSDDIRVEVADADAKRALALKAQYERGPTKHAQLVEETHPAKGIPFYAIWVFSGIITFVVWDGFALVSLLTGIRSIAWTDLNVIGNLALILFCAPVLISFSISAGIFVIWLLVRIFKRRRRKTPTS